MGTRYEDQPVEQWAGPESLDPTPVWKQYVLVALLLFVGLVVVVVFSVMALAPNFVTPPALVPGERLVLSVADLPAVGADPKLVTAPVIDVSRSFYLVQPTKGDLIAVRVTWQPRAGEPGCRVTPFHLPPPGPPLFTVSDCAALAPTGMPFYFDSRGERLDGRPPRGLDQYLVSLSGDRIVVNLSRVIEPSERTGGPVPTGIPQPQTQQP